MPNAIASSESLKVRYSTVSIQGIDIFYREADEKTAPVLLLLHGFPTSSNMLRNLIRRLTRSFRVIAPDYPGYGFRGMPDRKDFSYTFGNVTSIVEELTKKLELESMLFISWTMVLRSDTGLHCLASDDASYVTGIELSIDGWAVQV